MRTLEPVVGDELVQRAPQMPGAEQDQPLQALALDRLHESLGDRIHVRRLEGGLDDLHVGVVEDAAELGGELAVAVEGQEAPVVWWCRVPSTPVWVRATCAVKSPS